MDIICDRECGNGREGEAGVFCTDCFVGLAGRLDETV